MTDFYEEFDRLEENLGAAMTQGVSLEMSETCEACEQLKSGVCSTENSQLNPLYKKIAIQAIIGFVYWTGMLTPYMLFWVGLSWTQYIKWASASLILTPILAPGSIWFNNKIMKLFKDKNV